MIRRIPLGTLQDALRRTLIEIGFDAERASRCASIFAANSAVGVSSHGLNRFPLFVEFVRRGIVLPSAEMTCTSRLGAWEQWNGNLGAGPLNAYDATQRVVALAQRHGIGCVGLQQTNHWMRGGYYGWMAAEAGLAFMAWTNTTPNMPPWGAADSRLGNNPLVLAAPRASGPVVLDMAMSQFSFGRLETHLREATPLPVPGGYDSEGRLSTVAGDILRTGRVLPIGFWKGAGLSLMLDMLAALVSGGDASCRIGRRDPEYGLSQVFIAFDVGRTGGAQAIDQLMDEVVADLHSASPEARHGPVRYPGERVSQIRQESLDLGVPVDADIWKQLLAGI